jgi:hypothetical protein
MPHDLHSDQAIPPAKYMLLVILKPAICGYFVDEDEWDTLSCYIVGYRVPVHRQDRPRFPVLYTVRRLLK